MGIKKRAWSRGHLNDNEHHDKHIGKHEGKK